MATSNGLVINIPMHVLDEIKNSLNGNHAFHGRSGNCDSLQLSGISEIIDMIRYWNLALILGVNLMISSLLSCAGELMFIGRSAQDVFNNDGVFKLLKVVSRHDGVEAKPFDSALNSNPSNVSIGVGEVLG